MARIEIAKREDLDGKANVNHEHSIGEISNLQNELDGKANVNHEHSIGEISNLQNELDGKANVNHEHSIGEISNLQNELDGKASSDHSHNYSEINGTPNIPSDNSELSNGAGYIDGTYDNSSSGLTATDIQSAIDELKSMIDDLQG